MNRMKFTESWTKVTDRSLSRIETKLDLTFPPQYRTFLMRHNGGHPRPSTFTLNNSTIKVALFYSAGGDSDIDIVQAQKNVQTLIKSKFSEEERPKFAGLLIIAEDVNGNFIFLGTDGDNENHVFYFDKKNKSDPLTLVSKSFNDFLNAFSGDEEDSDDSDLDAGAFDEEDDYGGRRGRRTRGKKVNYNYEYDDDDDDDSQG